MTWNPRARGLATTIALVATIGVGRVATQAPSDGPATERVASVGPLRLAPSPFPWSTRTTVKPPAPTSTTGPAAPSTTATPATTTVPLPVTTTAAPSTTTTKAPAKPPATTAPAPISTTRPPATTTTTRPAPTTTTTRPATTVTAPPVVASGLSAATQADMLAQVNAKRATGTTCGGASYPAVPALTLQATLTAAAAGHANDMASHDYFSHTGLDGRDPGTRITAAGYRWRAWAENIAAGQPTPTSVIAAWFASAGHCENFMSAAVTQVGFAEATRTGTTYGTYWVADLGRPA